jgi:hypothetical protein
MGDLQKQYLISHETRDALLSYLFNRPYAEVARGVEMLNALPEFIEAKAEDSTSALKLATKE